MSKTNNPTEDVLADLLSEAPEGSFGVVISRGAPCSCGPGFCWRKSTDSGFGLGGYGYAACDRDKGEKLPDCPHCEAPGQGVDETGRALCWNCCEYHEEPFRTKPVPEEEKPYHEADLREGASRAREWLKTTGGV